MVSSSNLKKLQKKTCREALSNVIAVSTAVQSVDYLRHSRDFYCWLLFFDAYDGKFRW